MKAKSSYDVLSFVEATGHRGIRFFEPALNRRPLSSLLSQPGLTGTFGWQDAKIEKSFAFQLLRREPSKLPSGRVPLTLCGECADLGCGCVAVLVSELEECVVWSAFAFDDPHPRRDPPGELVSSFPDVRDYYFLRSDYEDALSRFSSGHRMRPR